MELETVGTDDLDRTVLVKMSASSDLLWHK